MDADEQMQAFEFGGAWGVGGKRSILYEASFVERTAREIARIENEGHDYEWEELEEVLLSNGFDVTHVEPVIAAK